MNEIERLQEQWKQAIAARRDGPARPQEQLPTVINDAQRAIILGRTPPSEIKFRKGRGGKMLAYVETGYVVETLNLACGFNWDFEVVKAQYWSELDEVIVHGRLTVRVNGHTITKSQYGGAEVKRSKETGEIICLADDYKAAASDALKKCASLFGIAHDIYRGQIKPPTNNQKHHWIDNDEVRRRFWAFAKATLGLSEAEVYKALGVSHVHDFPGTMKDAKAVLEGYALDVKKE